MLVCHGDLSRLQVALLIYGPNVTFRCRGGGLGKRRLILFRSYIWYWLFFFRSSPTQVMKASVGGHAQGSHRDPDSVKRLVYSGGGGASAALDTSLAS